MTYGEMYRRGEQELLEAGIEEAGLEARLFAGACLRDEPQ